MRTHRSDRHIALRGSTEFVMSKTSLVWSYARCGWSV